MKNQGENYGCTEHIQTSESYGVLKSNTHINWVKKVYPLLTDKRNSCSDSLRLNDMYKASQAVNNKKGPGTQDF